MLLTVLSKLRSALRQSTVRRIVRLAGDGVRWHTYAGSILVGAGMCGKVVCRLKSLGSMLEVLMLMLMLMLLVVGELAWARDTRLAWPKGLRWY